MKNTYTGLLLRAGGQGFSLDTKNVSPGYSYRNKRKIEPKELPCFAIHLLLIADTQQIEILATAPLTQASNNIIISHVKLP